MILKLVREGLGRVIVFIDDITRPKPVERSAADQASVEEAAAHLALYQFHACPFCIKTRRAIRRLRLPIDLRDAQSDADHRSALRDGGGKVQVPCLLIQGDGEPRWLYESGEIIAYLTDRFDPARQSSAKPVEQAS